MRIICFWRQQLQQQHKKKKKATADELTPCSSPCKANSSSASQEIPRILRNPQVHHCVHKSLPLSPILSQINLSSNPGNGKRFSSSPKHPDRLWAPPSLQWVPGFFPGGKAAGA
jgi:hypothetical protein